MNISRLVLGHQLHSIMFPTLLLWFQNYHLQLVKKLRHVLYLRHLSSNLTLLKNIKNVYFFSHLFKKIRSKFFCLLLIVIVWRDFWLIFVSDKKFCLRQISPITRKYFFLKICSTQKNMYSHYHTSHYHTNKIVIVLTQTNEDTFGWLCPLNIFLVPY